jgi:hypothetical protein
MTSDSIRRNIVVCDGGDMTDDAIQPNSSCSGIYVLVYVMATYGLLIQLMLHSAYVSSGLVKHCQSSYDFLEMNH